MIKRRKFIRNSAMGLAAGIAGSTVGITQGSCTPAPQNAELQSGKSWQTDPEWLEVKFGDWGGPGVSSKPGPMDTILLKDHAPRSTVVTAETFVPKPKFPAFDSHVHVVARKAEDIADWVKTMDEVGMEKSLVLTGATGEAYDELVKSLVKAYPGRFHLYCGMDLTDIESSGFPRRLADELERCHEMGAIGVGEISDKGTGITRDASLPPGKRLHPDDSRLDLFWEKCAELKMPVNLHVADHPSCWTPLDVFQERTPDYQHFNLYDKGVPPFDELIAKRNRTLEKHPDTIFIACHLGNQGHNLALLSEAMDRYPNLYLDTSARDYELGRTPRSSAKFLARYKNRIVFGTDMGRKKSMYQIHWRLFETADEYIPGRVGWRYYGLELHDDVLRALYRDTANNIFNI
ncbi:MAG: amidohydrolase family protein [Prolixibacteraceae bacterium]|nr:amidohydrolase family protein [Prolixibacteraceae bacterium]